MGLEDRTKSAQNYARRVIIGSFKQTIDEDILDAVVEKILRALPERISSEDEVLGNIDHKPSRQVPQV